jgi:hypothetical protein
MTRSLVVVMVASLIGCGGSEFQTGAGGTTADASAGGAGEAGTGGTAGSGGTGGVAGVGGTGGGTGGTAGVSGTGGDAGTGTTCAGVCAPDAAGWEGPFLVIEGPADATKPCPGDYAQSLPMSWFDTPESASPTCECSCSVNSEADVSAEVQLFSEKGCMGEPCTIRSLNQNTCATAPKVLDCDPKAESWRALAVGACEPQPPQLPPWKWALKAQVCAPSVPVDGACGSGGKCLPFAPTGGAICVSREGEATCPEGYDDRRRRFQEADDQRVCGSCFCQPEQAVQTLRFYGVSTCGTETQFVDVPSVCGNNPALEMGNFMKLTSKISETPVPCSAPPAPIVGSVKPQGMVTVCCMP